MLITLQLCSFFSYSLVLTRPKGRVLNQASTSELFLFILLYCFKIFIVQLFYLKLKLPCITLPCKLPSYEGHFLTLALQYQGQRVEYLIKHRRLHFQHRWLASRPSSRHRRHLLSLHTRHVLQVARLIYMSDFAVRFLNAILHL